MNLRPALRLCRIPNVFTAVADVAAGVLLARGGALRAGDLALLAAGALLYCAGMILNDYFDREVDARERPDRPIPSGEISATAAAIAGFSCLAGGVALAATAGGAPRSVALALAAAILFYDGGLKKTALGPLCMGACRFLSLSLGLSVAASALPLWTCAAPAALGLYTVIITFWSRSEVGGGDAAQARLGVLAMGGLFAAVILVMTFAAPARGLAGALGVAPFVLFAAARGIELFKPLLHQATPPLLGRAIGGGILLMPAIDAIFVAGAGHFFAACGVFLLALPSYALKRAFYVT